ncbi:hypothetical protein C8R44DRAFT_876831 [Mycena epipterygia]|nr:hypothetical protein C8R44DRAFT_876831 [Mycena epipterygia]
MAFFLSLFTHLCVHLLGLMGNAFLTLIFSIAALLAYGIYLALLPAVWPGRISHDTLTRIEGMKTRLHEEATRRRSLNASAIYSSIITAPIWLFHFHMHVWDCLCAGALGGVSVMWRYCVRGWISRFSDSTIKTRWVMREELLYLAVHSLNGQDINTSSSPAGSKPLEAGRDSGGLFAHIQAAMVQSSICLTY